MIVIGIDPGSRNCGYSVLELAPTKMALRECGTWELMQGNTKRSLGARLELLYEHSLKLFKKYNPRIVGLEKAVSFKSVPSAFVLSEARGVLKLALFQALEKAEDRLIEISPTQVKRSTTGSGASNKEAVQKMLSVRFQELSNFSDSAVLGADAFDALAVAWAAWIVHKGKHGSKIGTELRS